MIVGFLLMWAVLLFRKAALMLVAVFAPIAFAGSVWDHTRIWTRRWIEVVVALVFCKVVIVVVFVVGASAFSGVGPTVSGGDTTAVAAKPAASLSDLLVGLLLLTIAVFAPWVTWRFVHWSGMEAAAVMHGAVMAGPVPNAVRASGSQARFMAQSAVTTMVMGGAGAAAGGGGAAAASGGASARAGGGTASGAPRGVGPPAGPDARGSGSRPAAGGHSTAAVDRPARRPGDEDRS
jgi:type IV secretory pathway VirB6-like protein